MIKIIMMMMMMMIIIIIIITKTTQHLRAGGHRVNRGDGQHTRTVGQHVGRLAHSGQPSWVFAREMHGGEREETNIMMDREQWEARPGREPDSQIISTTTTTTSSAQITFYKPIK